MRERARARVAAIFVRAQPLGEAKHLLSGLGCYKCPVLQPNAFRIREALDVVLACTQLSRYLVIAEVLLSEEAVKVSKCRYRDKLNF